MHYTELGTCPSHSFVPVVLMQANSIFAINCHWLGFAELWLSRAKSLQQSHDSSAWFCYDRRQLLLKVAGRRARGAGPPSPSPPQGTAD